MNSAIFAGPMTRSPHKVSSSLSERIDHETGEISFRTSSGAIFSAEQYIARVRNILATKSISNFTGGLAEDHLAYLLRMQTVNRAVGVIDRHSGRMPDLYLLHDKDSYFIEVKTVGAKNQLVLKEGQVSAFSEVGEKCIFAFTEHNLLLPKNTLLKRGGRKKMSEVFGLVRIIFVDAATVQKLYGAEDQIEYTFQVTSNGSYKNYRLGRIERILEKMKIPLRVRAGGKILLAGDVPDILPDNEFCTQFLTHDLVDCSTLKL